MSLPSLVELVEGGRGWGSRLREDYRPPCWGGCKADREMILRIMIILGAAGRSLLNSKAQRM